MPDRYEPTQSDVEKLLQMQKDVATALAWQRALKVNGADLKNTTLGATIDIPPPKKQTLRQPEGDFVYSIVSSTQDGANYRWTYSLQRQKKTGSKWDGWEDDTAFAAVDGYNLIESKNDSETSAGQILSTITMGEGVTGIDAIPDNTLVEAWIESATGDDGKPVAEYWFAWPNNAIVNCPPPSSTPPSSGDGE